MRVKGAEKSRKSHWADIFMDYRRLSLGVVAIVTAALGFLVPQLNIDRSLQSLLVTESPSRFEYEKFLAVFGEDDYLLLTITNERGVDNWSFLASLSSITEELEQLEGVESVLSVCNLKIFQKRGEKYGNWPVVRGVKESLVLPEETDLQQIRRALPETDLLLSRDKKTAGVVIELYGNLKYEINEIRKVVARVETISVKHSIDGSETRIVGPPILRQAIPKYSVQTSLIFGVLCTIVCTAVTSYIFRSARITILTIMILSVSIVWVLGLMTLMNVSLNAATSISFGLILITTLEIVIHMFIRFSQFSLWVGDRESAIRETVRYLARPCLVSAATTAVGFGSCMVTPIPMVFQLGLIMSVGVMISYFLCMILTPAIISVSRSLDIPVTAYESDDLLSRILSRVSRSIQSHHRFWTVFGLTISILMFGGTPLIQTDPQILRQLGDGRPEVKDLAAVEKNLTSVQFLELIIDSGENTGSFKNPEMWDRIRDLESRLKQIPEVLSTSSLLPFLEHMASLIGGPSPRERDLLASSGTLSEMFMMTSLTAEGKRFIRSHLDEDFRKLRISVRIKNSPSVPILTTIRDIHSLAETVMQGSAKVCLTGEPVVVAYQGDDLIKSETRAMAIAIGLVAILMMLHTGSWLLGLLSLIPNIPPLAAVFGMMGWLGIPLDGVTIFAATVSLGLAMDNTIQYLSQLKREMTQSPNMDEREAVFIAYGLSARPMASWSIVMLLGFLSLLVTPFQAAFHFGVLVSSAIVMGIFGDLVFMQSMILSCSPIRKLIRREMLKGTSPECLSGHSLS